MNNGLGAWMTANTRLYVQALYGFDAVVQRTDDAQWARPAPCDGWTARDVVSHVAWSMDMFTRMADGHPVSVPDDSGTGVPTPSDDGHVFDAHVLEMGASIGAEVERDPIETWNRYRSGFLKALDRDEVASVVTRSPWGETDMDGWLGFAIWDPLVHTWDLAKAVDQPVLVDPDLCERALAHAKAFGSEHNLRRPGVAAAPTTAPAEDPLSRLLAFAGRDLAWKGATDDAR